MSVALQHPRDVKSILLIDVARSIREAGKIWLIRKTVDGIIFHGTVAGQQVRVLVQLPGSPQPQLPPDPLSVLHVASTIPALQAFLNELVKAAPLDPILSPL